MNTEKRGRLYPITLLLILGLVFPLSGPSYASSGTEGASFLDIPVGARPAALGGSYSALASDAYAPVWNPAGLGFLQGPELAGQHLSYIDSIHYEFLSFVYPLHKGRSLGASIQYLGTGDMDGTNLDATPAGSFSSHYASYNLAYGQTLTDRLSLGVTGKMINAKLADVSANAYALDFGSLYQVRQNLTAAATLTNIGNRLTFLSDGDPLPMALHLGASYDPISRLGLTGEFVYPRTGLAAWHMGAEWRPLPTISLRTGYKTDTLKELGTMAGLTAGMGIQVWGQEFAYAWSPYGDLGNTHYFSLLMRFGETEKAKRNLIKYQSVKRPHGTAKTISSDEFEYEQLQELLNEGFDHMAKKR
ncbi:MAG: PorV/PorQ family protein [Elusimicrobiota bacterium]|jgi:hypothetical protein